MMRGTPTSAGTEPPTRVKGASSTTSNIPPRPHWDLEQKPKLKELGKLVRILA
jgi:hypothetical protein